MVFKLECRRRREATHIESHWTLIWILCAQRVVSDAGTPEPQAYEIDCLASKVIKLLMPEFK